MPDARSVIEQHDKDKLQVEDWWWEDAGCLVVSLRCGCCSYSSSLQLHLSKAALVEGKSLPDVFARPIVY